MVGQCAVSVGCRSRQPCILFSNLTMSVVEITHENKLLEFGTYSKPAEITLNDGNHVYLQGYLD